MHPIKKQFLFWAKLSLGLGLLVLLFYQINFDDFLKVLLQVKIEYFFLSIVVSAISLFVKAYKWNLLLKLQGGGIGFLRASNLTFISIFFNNFFLGTLGGDGFRAIKTIDRTDKKAGAVSAIIMDRITGVVALMSVVIVSAGSSLIWETDLSKVPMMKQVFILGVISFFICVLVLIGLLKLHNVITVGKNKYFVFIMEVLQTLGRHDLTGKTMIVSFIMSIIYHLLTVWAMYLFVLAVGISISRIDLLVIVPIVSFLLMIPISVNGLGIQEGVFFYFFVLIGVTSEQALVISILPRIGVVVLSIVGAILFLLEKKTASDDTSR